MLCDIEAAGIRLVASGFDVPRSWIIVDPLSSIRGWYLGACGVEEIVRNAASEDSALQTVIEDIAKDVEVYLRGKIAKADQTSGYVESQDDDGADGLIDRLTDGPDDAELSPREAALLEAYLKQPVSMAAIQREKQATGESETNTKRNKLKLISDFNRNR